MVSSRVTLFLFWASVSTFLIILTIIESDGFKPTEHLYVDHLTYQFNPKYTKNCSTKLSFINRTRKSVTSLCLVTKTIDNIFGYAHLKYRYRNGWQTFLVDIGMNLCDYINSKSGSIFLDIILPKVDKYLTTTNGLKCPFVGRFDIKNLPLTGSLFDNRFLPVGDYMANLTLTTSTKELLWNGKIFFNIPAGMTIEDDRMGR